MSGKPEKVVIIGFDAPIPHRLYEYAMRGLLPNIRRLIEEGVYCENCLVPHPTITPPNWTTIVTGAWPGTHGITCFNLHKPGTPLEQVYQAFDSADCRAEYLWEAAERAGKRAIVLNYPSTWPPRGRNVVQVGGAGLAINEWRRGLRPWGFRVTLGDAMLFTTEDYPLAKKIQLRRAEGWANLPGEVRRALEATLVVDFPRALFRVEPVTWHLLLLDMGEGFKIAAVSKVKDYAKAFAVLEPGQWSPVIEDEFATERGPYKAVFRLKLIELAEDGSRLRLFLTPICALRGNSVPDGLVERIQRESDGLPLPSHSVYYEALGLGWVDHQTFLELVDMEHRWLADAACWLMRNFEWDIFVMHAHCPDWAYHVFSNKLDPSTAGSKEEVEEYTKLEIGFYQSLDRMVGRIVDAAGDDALVILTSDHGAKPSGRPFPVAKILEEAGLLAYKEEGGERVIDWSRTLAVPQRSCYIYVNLKGRDPHGIVPPEKYDEVRDRVISALYDYTDPETGVKPVVFALKKEDARVIGLYGDRVGDVVFALRGEFGGQHGPHITTARYGIGSLKGLLIMKGPGVKRGVRLQRTVWLTDIVPTVCYLAELPIPRDAEGAIIYQALEDPDCKIKELRELREKYRKLEEMVRAERELTHTYFAE